MRNRFLSVFLLLCACGGKLDDGVETGSDAASVDFCTEPSNCPSDLAPTSDEVAACETELTDTCGAAIAAYEACLHENETCDALGFTDPASKLDAAMGPCSAELGVASQCCETNDGACAAGF